MDPETFQDFPRYSLHTLKLESTVSQWHQVMLELLQAGRTALPSPGLRSMPHTQESEGSKCEEGKWKGKQKVAALQGCSSHSSELFPCSCWRDLPWKFQSSKVLRKLNSATLMTSVANVVLWTLEFQLLFLLPKMTVCCDIYFPKDDSICFW